VQTVIKTVLRIACAYTIIIPMFLMYIFTPNVLYMSLLKRFRILCYRINRTNRNYPFKIYKLYLRFSNHQVIIFSSAIKGAEEVTSFVVKTLLTLFVYLQWPYVFKMGLYACWSIFYVALCSWFLFT
jgi:hypothetical protein